MNAAEIARALRGTPSGRGWLCRCPVPSHGKGKGDRNPSLHIADGDSTLLLKCYSGCDTRDVLTELRRRGLLDDRAASPVAPHGEIVAEGTIEPNPDALALWRQGEAIDGNSIARRYLRARGITIDPPPSLRFLPAYEHIEGRVYFPAIVAAFQAGDRRIIAAQVTMIDPRGERKAQCRFPRKTFGRMGDGAVRLGPAGEALGLAEGIETGLAAMQLSGVPVWCCLGAARMPTVKIPESVRELHIFADNDEPGRAAAEKIARAHMSRRVVIHLPPPEFNDFADVALDMAKSEAAA